MATLKIKKGDTVKILSGKDRGKRGKVSKVLPGFMQVVVEGLNVKKKHVRPRRQGQKGEVIAIAAPVPISKVQLVCSACGQPTRPSSGRDNAGKKVRLCRRCGGIA